MLEKAVTGYYVFRGWYIFGINVKWEGNSNGLLTFHDLVL